WNSAVESVMPLNDATPAAGRRYAMQRKLPTGPAMNELEIVTLRSPQELAICTTSGPTPFVYRYEFATTHDGTLVRLYADVRVSAAGVAMGASASPRNETFPRKRLQTQKPRMCGASCGRRRGRQRRAPRRPAVSARARARHGARAEAGNYLPRARRRSLRVH